MFLEAWLSQLKYYGPDGAMDFLVEEFAPYGVLLILAIEFYWWAKSWKQR